MSVYVDNPKHNFGRMKMCHMVADTTEELLAMAKKVGVHARWVQAAGTAKEHFDVCKSARAEAVALGAVEVSGKFIVGLIRKRRFDYSKERNADKSKV